ncbi:MAG: hypothetical protein RH859_07950 [Longimicrobiales bacterium]
MTDAPHRGRRLIVRVTAELGVIFLGVTAAFLVEGWRQNHESRARVQHLTEALMEHLAAEDSVTGRMIATISGGLDQWQADADLGRRPVPFVVRIDGSLHPPVGVWEAVKESAAADLLDPRVLLQLSVYYNEIFGTADRFVPHNTFAEFEILPHLPQGSAAFYDASGALRPEFAAYMDRAADYRDSLARNREANRALVSVLSRAASP